MVSILWGTIALSSGLLLYLAPPALAPLLPMEWRLKIGHYYFGQCSKSFRNLAFVRRLLSGYELHPIGVDDEQRLAQVTLSSGIISDDKKLPFKDPDDRISRLYQKPTAVVPEILPAAVDAELAEMAHWVQQKELNEGLHRDGRVDPYVRVKDSLRLVDPMDVINLVGKDVEPENVETCTQLTKQRFEKYNANIGLAETLGTLTGFAFGVGAVAGIQYLQQNLLDGGGGGASAPVEIPMGLAIPPLPVTVVDVLGVLL